MKTVLSELPRSNACTFLTKCNSGDVDKETNGGKYV